MTYEDKDSGSISEWNEGNFKNLRLHEAQEMINVGKVNPFSLSEDKQSWNYEMWKAGIDILFGEGKAKYSDEESEEVEKVKELLERFLELRVPFKLITEHSFGTKRDRFIPIKDNQKKIKEVMEMYESIVKKYNDEHGLSTKNADKRDWRGL